MQGSQSIENPFKPFLNTFSCCGWVPTIRGKLTLNLFNSDNIWGDTDKYAIAIKTYKEFNEKTAHYLVASSLYTFVDNKKGDFCRTFRFIFRASINDEDLRGKFIQQNFEGDETEASKSIEEKELLVGRLSIIVKLKKELSEKEAELLGILSEFKKEKEVFSDDFIIRAVVPSELDEKRKELKSRWDEAVKKIDDIEDELDRQEDDRLYKFEVVLSRDGILFLKDVTIDRFKKDYFKDNDTIDNYKKYTPIPRVFKTSIHFIKFLFHKNYHHSDENDTFLPASNLHHIRNGKGWIERINKHQFDAFLTPIIHAKRNKRKNLPNCNPTGILLYAQSFLNILEKNKLILPEEADFERKLLEAQKNEFEEYYSDRKVTRNTFLAQNHLAVQFSVGFAVMAAAITIHNFLFENSPYPKWNAYSDITTAYQRLYFLLISFSVGLLVHNWIKNYYLSFEYSLKKERRSILNRCSDTKKIKDEENKSFWNKWEFFQRFRRKKKYKFSVFYRLRLHLIEIQIYAGLYGTAMIKFLGAFVAGGTAVYFIYKFLIYLLQLPNS